MGSNCKSDQYYMAIESRGKAQNSEDAVISILRSIVSITTIILVFLVYRHYKLDLQFLKIKENIDFSESLASTGNLKYLIFEVILCLIHSPPMVNFHFEGE